MFLSDKFCAAAAYSIIKKDIIAETLTRIY
jgi:hypothetical protein